MLSSPIIKRDRLVYVPSTARHEAAASRAPSSELLPVNGVKARGAEADELAIARAKAQRLLGEAKSRAEFLIDDALRGAERLAEEARREGREQGLREAAEQARAEARRAGEEAAAILEKARRDAEALFQQEQGEAIRLALAVAKKVIGREAQLDPEVMAGLVRSALERVKGAASATVKVAPELVEATASRQGTFGATRLGIGECRVEGDPGLEPGDCVTETPNGTVDLRLDRQLEKFATAISEVMEQKP